MRQRQPSRVLSLLAVLLAFIGATVASADTRVALIIGNSNYTAVEALKNPVNDATDIAAALESVGFEVTLGLDLDRQAMIEAIAAFVTAARGADVSLFYYAGHAFQIDNENFLVPADAVFRNEDDIAGRTARLTQLIEGLRGAGGTHLVFLDACRNNPVAALLQGGARNVEDGLARIGDAAGFLFAFSTQPGNVAYDGLGRNSYFTGALLSHIETPGQDIGSTMISVRNDVLAATGGRQVPWENSSLTRQFYFRPGQPEASPETILYQVAAQAEDPALMRFYLERYPDGAHVTDVRQFLGAAPAALRDTVTRDLASPEQAAALEEQLWSLARRLRSPSLAETYLEQHPDGAYAEQAQRLLATLAGEAGQEAAPGPLCERLATHPNDATANTAGVPLAELAIRSEAAIRACRAAVEARPDVPHLMALLARSLQAAGRTEEAVGFYRDAAEQGDLRAMVSLGLMSEFGSGMPRDVEAARAYYLRAAEGGSADGAINLAVMLEEGNGVRRDLAEAERWLRQAADAGSPLATFNLGALLARHGQAEDYPRALDYFRTAARMGESRAYFPAAVLLDKGLGLTADPEAAAELLLAGAAEDSGQSIAGITSPSVTWAPATIEALQARLAEAGMYRGAVDGLAGPQLEAALRDWRQGGLLRPM